MKKIGIGFVLSVMAVFMTSCSLDSGGNSYLGVYPNVINSKATAGTATFKVYYTDPLSLSITEGGDWCSVSPKSIAMPKDGYDSTTVTVTYQANTLDKARQTQVYIKGGVLENYVIVKQEAAVKE